MDRTRVNLIFGRFNPPTIGHERLLRNAMADAQRNAADMVVFVSHTQDTRKNPLSYQEKVDAIRKAIPAITIGPENIRTPFEALTWAAESGYREIIILVGSDRIDDFTTLINAWQKKVTPTPPVSIEVSALPRTGKMSAKNVSSTTARLAARQNDVSTFLSIFMGGQQNPRYGKDVMKKIQDRLGSIQESDTFDEEIDIDRLVEMLLLNDAAIPPDAITTFDNPGARSTDDDSDRVPEDTKDNKSVLILYPERKLKLSMLDKLQRKKQDYEREQEQKRAQKHKTKY